MQKTQLDYIRKKQQAQDSYYYAPGYWYGGYGYGYPYGYFGWNIAPSIVFRGGGGFHGGGGHRGR